MIRAEVGMAFVRFPRPSALLAPALALALVLTAPLDAQTLVPAWAGSEPGAPDFGAAPLACRQLDDGTLLTVLWVFYGPAFALHTDRNGALLGRVTLTYGYEYGGFPAVAIDGFGAVYLGATTRLQTFTLQVAKFDGFTGRPLWPAPFRVDSALGPRIALDAAGNLLVAGSEVGGTAVIASRLRGSDGAILWGAVRILPPASLSAGVSAIAVDPAGDLLVAGSFSASGVDGLLFFARIAGGTGALLAGPAAVGASGRSLSAAYLAPLSGGAVVAGASNGASEGDVAVVRFDASGSVLWSRSLHQGGAGYDNPSALTIAPGGDVFLTASLMEGPRPIQGTYRLSSADGVPLWGPVVLDDAASRGTYPSALLVTRDGNAVVRSYSYVANDSPDALLTEIDGLAGTLRWGPVRVASMGSLAGPLPMLIAPDGNLLLILAGAPSFSWHVVLDRFAERDGALAASAELPSRASSGFVTSLVVDPAGDVVATLDVPRDDVTDEIRTVKYAGSSGIRTWGPVTSVLLPRNGYQTALDPNGDVLEVATTWNGARSVLALAKRRGSDGVTAWGPITWDPGVEVQRVHDMRVDSQGRVVVALGEQGRNEVAWFRGDTGSLAFPSFSWPAASPPNSLALLVGPGDSVTCVEALAGGTTTVRRLSSSGGLAWGPVSPSGAGGTAALDPSGNVLLTLAANDGTPDLLVAKRAAADGTSVFESRIPWPTANAPFEWRLLCDAAGNAFLATTELAAPMPLFAPVGVRLRKISGGDGSLLDSSPLWTDPAGGWVELAGAALDPGGNPVVAATAFDGVRNRIVVLEASNAALSSLSLLAEFRERHDASARAFALRGANPVVGGTSVAREGTLVVAFDGRLGFSVAPDQVPPALCGTAWTFPFHALGGRPPYAFVLAAGSLPPGLTLDPSGVLSGSPLVAGFFAFRLRVTDKDGRLAEADFDVTVSPAADVAISATPAATSCDGTVLSVAGTWAAYSWVPGGETAPTITVRPPYDAPFGVVVTDAGGCVHHGSVIVPASSCANAATFTALPPCRLLDTRLSGAPLAAGETRTVPAVGSCGVPAGAWALALNVTAVNPGGNGSLALTPAGEPHGDARALAVRAGRTRAGFTMAGLSPAGALDVFADLDGGGATDLVLDVSGYFR